MSEIKMIPVSSSNVASVGYDENAMEMKVQFLKGGAYIYKGVPKQVFEDLLAASSIGSYLHRNIKNVYHHERIG